MFENVPQRTIAYVRDQIPALVAGKPPEEKYIVAAGAVIAEYLGKLYWRSNDPYINWKRTEAEGLSWNGAPLRMLQIAESLFQMRNIEGFQYMCDRFKARELRSTFFELYSAKAFLRVGYDVIVKPESGVKKEDFDFSAAKENTVVNVECTALEEKAFYDKTLLNALNRKRTQLPNNAPAAIFLFIPQEWEGALVDINQHFDETARTFLRGTRKINAICGVVQRISGIEMAMISRPYYNENPRFPFDMSAVFTHSPFPQKLKRIMSFTNKTRKEQALLREYHFKGEFFRWVDSLIP